MNYGALLLFSNAIIVTVLASIFIFYILRKEYLPVIRHLEKEEQEQEQE